MWSISKDIAFRIVDREAFVLDVKRRKVHRINEIGAFVLQGVEEGREEASILNEIVEKYDVDEDTARRDISIFLDKLSEKKIIQSRDG